MKEPTKEELGSSLLERRKVRRSMLEWYRHNGYEPSAHHSLILNELQAVSDGHTKRLMILVPPGSGKSVMCSVLFPPWYLANHPQNSILSCSYSHTLAERFGKRCRNLIDVSGHILGYQLSRHSQAADDWETDKGGIYFCAGVGAGIAGHRADLGLIDDPLGSQEDADSKLMREKQIDWWNNDFTPRLKPNAPIVFIANRRHEEDLAGYILDKEKERWKLIRLPMEAEDDDPIGRPRGKRLWSDWFTEQMVADARINPRTWAGLYQQRPAPEEGSYFLRDWMQTYDRKEYDTLMTLQPKVYGSADWAVSEAKGSNRTCMLCGAMDPSGMLYILPDAFWKTAGPKELVSAFVDMLKRRNPLAFVSEKGHISKSLGPFIREEMLAASVYNYIAEVVPVRDKESRAQSIRGRMSMLRVKFPSFASWWPDAMHEMLTFPAGKNDDFVDAIAHLGMYINNMAKGSGQVTVENEDINRPFVPTMGWLKKLDKEYKEREKERYDGR